MENHENIAAHRVALNAATAAASMTQLRDSLRKLNEFWSLRDMAEYTGLSKSALHRVLEGSSMTSDQVQVIHSRTR